ncbi:hypothetical protein TNCV_598151 [Trichonephila clavipes]|nr:hypothetical protein TNCV_598151 [Trichonephila clavipes]
MRLSWSHKLKRDLSEKTTWCQTTSVLLRPWQTQPLMQVFFIVGIELSFFKSNTAEREDSVATIDELHAAVTWPKLL